MNRKGDRMTAGDTISLYCPHTHMPAHAQAHTRNNSIIGKCCHLLSSCHPDRLDDLARAVQRLIPDRRDPERFHADKSEIVATLRRMAREARR